jgi:energy-converting hydrogenase Eha subunit A
MAALIFGVVVAWLLWLPPVMQEAFDFDGV